MNLTSAQAARSTSGQKLHPLIWSVLLFTIISSFGGKLFDKNISSFGWIVPFLVALVSLLKGQKGFNFPIKIWLSWIIIIVLYQLLANADNSFQRSIMLLTPSVVGVAASRIRLDEQDLHYFLKLVRLTAIALILIVLFKNKKTET